MSDIIKLMREKAELADKLTNYEDVASAADEYVNIVLKIDELTTYGLGIETPELKQEKALKMQALVSALVWLNAYKRDQKEALEKIDE